MDMPNVDLYQLLNPPGIVYHVRVVENKLSELTDLITENYQGSILVDISQKISKQQLLKELTKSFHITNFRYEDDVDTFYEFRGQMKDKYPVARFDYILDKDKKPRLSRIIYRRENQKTLVIIYKLNLKGKFDWENPKNISHILLDIGGVFEESLRKMYDYFKFREERRKEEGLVLIA